MERSLVSFQKILALDPIPEADRIEAATILGWRVVVKKGEFSVGDICVFFEIDSVIPFNPWVAFLNKDRAVEPQTIRLRTVKMKKQISQGLALPVTSIPQLDGVVIEDGKDLTELLGVVKYEPYFASHDGTAKGTRPHWIPKTDETRVQSIPWIIEHMQGKVVYVTQKLDGSSMSIGRHAVEGDAICSRNQSYKLDCESRFVNVGNPLLVKLPVGYLIQGELVGPGIQSNRLGLDQLSFFCFNVYELETGRLLGFYEMSEFCAKYEIPMVPVIKHGVFEWNSVDEILKDADGKYPGGHPHEGIVIRPIVPESHHKLGMLSFKAISNEFLLKIGE